jgi:hypothetical protein
MGSKYGGCCIMKVLTYQDRQLVEMDVDPSFCASYVNIEKLKKEGFWFDKRDGCWKREVQTK